MYKSLSKKVVLPKIRTYIQYVCLSNNAPEIWNALPDYLHTFINKKT